MAFCVCTTLPQGWPQPHHASPPPILTPSRHASVVSPRAPTVREKLIK